MSGVLRRGSINFDCNSWRKSNSNGEYGSKVTTPEISVISIDFRRYSEDLKKKPQLVTSKENNAKDLSQNVDSSDVISNFIGHFGLWQFIWTCVLSLFQIPSTFHIFSFVFQSAEKDFWCARTSGMTEMNINDWRNLTQPDGSCSILNFAFNEMKETNFEDYLQLSRNNTVKCESFEFSHSDMGITLVEEYNLVCDRRNLLSVVEMCFLAGAAVGSVSSGLISDRFGRKHTLMSFALIQAIFGTLLAFSTSLAMFMMLRVIIGFASMTVTVVSFVLVVELVSGKFRTIIGILNILPVAISYIVTSGIAYLARDWRLMQLVISMPWILLLFMWYCVPESPRWLLARGRVDGLCALIERAAKMNGRTLPANYRKSLEAEAGTTATKTTTSSLSDKRDTIIIEMKKGESSATMSDTGGNGHIISSEIDCNASPLAVVFNQKYWKTTCLTLVVWLTLIIIYFGLTLHLSNLGGNIYLNTATAGLVEAISICCSIFVVLKLGIRQNLIAYMLISGICCLAVNLVPDGNLIGVIGLAMIAKCSIGASNAIVPTFTAQQYPTVVRNFGVGIGNLAAGVGLILVPYMWLLEHIEPLLPMTVMGVSGLIGAIALLLMKDVEQ